jgi:hypothetical protein
MQRLLKFAALMISSGLGYLIGQLVPDPLGVYASVLISYHLYLAILVMMTQREKGVTLPFLHAVFTHIACLAVVICMTVGRHYVPLFGIIRYFVPAMAPFEAQQIFGGVGKVIATRTQEAPPISSEVCGHETGEDYEEWIAYLAQPRRRFRKTGMNLRQEYEQFMLARFKLRAPGTVPLPSQAFAQESAPTPLQTIGAVNSAVEPEELVERAMDNSMDFESGTSQATLV